MGMRAYSAVAEVPRNRGQNTTLIASISPGGGMLDAAMTIEGSTDKAVFELYVERVLAPTLRPGEIVVMDNLAAHKGERVRELIDARGYELWYLPAYSPDFNPIEEAFSKIKAILRKAAARTAQALQQAVAEALAQITAADAAGYFRHCGYHIPDQLL